MKDFVHLHIHTEYSLLDGAARIKKLVKTAKEYGMKALAITDHGNMYGAIPFYKACKAADIKPIIGCEFYLVNDLNVKVGRYNYSHLILLAKNETGYHNISMLNTIAFRDGFYGKPRIDYKTLKEYSEGLICLSACLMGDVPKLILENRMEDAKKMASWYKDVFKDDYYLEKQNHKLNEDPIVNKGIDEIAKELNIKKVVTNDVHYINREDSLLQDVLTCVQTQSTIDDPNRFKFANDEFYFKTYDEMAQMFPDDLEALANTNEVADKCDFSFTFGHYHYPKFDVPDGQQPIDFLRKLIDEGLHKKYKEVTDVHRERIERELNVIYNQGFTEYFLTVWDYINNARKMGISVGPGRGSGAGSLVAYAIGITNIDPLKYDLLFERFLHSERVTAPDFDIDFADDRRDEIIQFVRNKYGDERVVKIITFGTMAAKNAIKDVARVFRMPYSVIDRVTKAIPNSIKRPNIIQKAFKLNFKEGDVDESVPELIEMYNSNEEIKKVVDIAAKLEDSPRQTGIHACGVIISPKPLKYFVPLARNGEFITTQFEGVDMEELGLLKFDFLGLRNLNDIQKTIQYIKQNHGIDVDFTNCTYDDPEVYKLISTGNTKAIFQIESGGFQRFMKELKPTCLEDIIAAVSLYRPGPMAFIPTYVHNKHHPEDTKYEHPILEPILNVTYGCIVYQEQVMRIVQDMAGYTLGQADMVRRMMSKKKREAMAAEKQKFLYGAPAKDGKPGIDGALKRGVSEEIASKVWSEMEGFASYAFNKSHAAAYSLITYQTAWLKRYYEPEFLTATLNNRITNADEIKTYVTYAKQEKIDVLPPDINKSETMFSVKDGKIRFGLAALKNVGIAVIDDIIAERNKNGDYTSLEDLINRLDGGAINKRCIESLILSGACDQFGKTRSQMMQVYPQIVEESLNNKKVKESGQFSLFDTLLKDDHINKVIYPKITEYDEPTKLKLEKEVVGVYISGHPLSKLADKFKEFTFTSDMIQVDFDENELVGDETKDELMEMEGNVSGLSDGMEVTTGGMITEVKKIISKRTNKEMAKLTIEDLYGSIEVMVFAQAYAKYRNILSTDTLVTIKGKLSIRGEENPTVLADTISLWQTTAPKEEVRTRKLYLRFNLQNAKLKQEVLNILKSHLGASEVVVKCTATNLPFKLDVTVSPDTQLINELYSVLSDEDIKLV